MSAKELLADPSFQLLMDLQLYQVDAMNYLVNLGQNHKVACFLLTGFI